MIGRKAIIEITEESNLIYKAVFPEVISSPSDRSNVKFRKSNKKLILSIESEDATAFRASLSSYIRWIKLCYKLKEGLK